MPHDLAGPIVGTQHEVYELIYGLHLDFYNPVLQ